MANMPIEAAAPKIAKRVITEGWELKEEATGPTPEPTDTELKFFAFTLSHACTEPEIDPDDTGVFGMRDWKVDEESGLALPTLLPIGRAEFSARIYEEDQRCPPHFKRIVTFEDEMKVELRLAQHPDSYVGIAFNARVRYGPFTKTFNGEPHGRLNEEFVDDFMQRFAQLEEAGRIVPVPEMTD